MGYIVKNRQTGSYLASPLVGRLAGKPDNIWPWQSDKAQAHVFASRAEAKETLRFVDRSEAAKPMSAFDFSKI